MPVINYQGSELAQEQKRELIHRLTRIASEVTGTGTLNGNLLSPVTGHN